ncbi:cation efflux family-domain-containing protein [Scheffersomyces amazonensis]|uniref:cation efflux family-domain-containing protein n=1 Tax=Scheffersomyces amazonensis TaxID=1078765 RepID=UPI00315CCCE4
MMSVIASISRTIVQVNAPVVSRRFHLLHNKVSLPPVHIVSNSFIIMSSRRVLSTRSKDGKANEVNSHTDVHSQSHEESHTHSHEESHSHSHDESHTHSHDESHGLFGHSHSHAHHQPNELLSIGKGSLKNPAVRITWIGLLVNVVMAGSKGIGGIYFHSQSLIADAIHSVSDMFADFLTLATVSVSSKVGTETKFPLGYGKIETVGSLLVSGVLLLAGISVGWSSLLQVFEIFLPNYIYEYVSLIQIGHSHSHTNLSFGDDDSQSHGHSHSHSSHEPSITEEITITREVPNINAAWLAGASIIVKELLFRKTMKIATATNSKVLVANAWHHRVDSLTAFVALLTVSGGVLFNIAWLDSIGGICVSMLIIRAGWGSFKTAWFELIDRGEKPGTEEYDRIKELVNIELELHDKLKLSSLSVLNTGANTNIFVKVLSTDEHLDLQTLNDIENKIKTSIRLIDKFRKNIFVRFVPQGSQKNENIYDTDSHSDTHTHSHSHSHPQE